MTPDEARFLRQFETCTLPAKQWTHRAHLHMAWLQLKRAPFATAVSRIRAGILRFNTEVLQKRLQYHDTITVAFTHLIAAGMTEDESFDDFCDRNHALLSRDPILLSYYSRDRLTSDEARTSFIPPDIKPLPRPGCGKP